MAYVTAIWFHADQAERARDLLSHVFEQGHLIHGWGEREDATALRRAGLAVRSYHDGPSPLFGEPAAALFTAGVRVTTVQEPLVPEEAWTAVYVTSLAGPLFTDWNRQLGEIGFAVVEHLGDEIYTVRGPSGADPLLGQFEFVLAARPYDVRDTWFPVFDPSGRLAVSEPALVCDLELHRGADPFGVLDMLSSLGVPSLGEPGHTVRVLLARTSEVLARIAAHPDVALIHEYRGAVSANDRVRHLVGLPASPVGQAGVPGGLDGSGELIAVADTGVDLGHSALSGRVRAVDVGGRSGQTDDPTGHGTHVAGTIAGDGANPGLAPAADLYVQSVTDPSGGLGGTADVRALLDDAVRTGALVHNNSWTRATGDGTYDAAARAIDERVRLHPELVVVVAAGNLGRQAGGPAAPGCLAYATVAAPATAKNALGVGASRSDRVGVVTTRPQTWRAWFPAFSADPIGRDALSGDPACLDARSGRGPCRGLDRVKPDLVAPGTFVRSANASTTPVGQAWADDPADPQQAYLGGTSMAAAVVSGGAALVRQHLRTSGLRPSAALVRAVLLNGAEWLSGWDSVQDHGLAPNYHQGFGRLDLAASLPDPAGPASLQVVDDWSGGLGWQFDSEGQQVVVEVDVGDSAALRICLVWDDPPGRAVQNVLHLSVENTDTGDVWGGNGDAPGFHHLPGSADSSNPVQVVRLDQPEPGLYDVTVTAGGEVLDGPQAFALAVTGDLRSGLAVSGP